MRYPPQSGKIPQIVGQLDKHIQFKQPLSLNSGDKVAIVSPSSGMPFLFPWVYEQGIDRLKNIFHLEPVEYPTARQSPKYLSQNPKARAEDINRAFADPSIKSRYCNN